MALRGAMKDGPSEIWGFSKLAAATQSTQRTVSRALAAATAGPTSTETTVRSVRPATTISQFAPVSPGCGRGGLAWALCIDLWGHGRRGGETEGDRNRARKAVLGWLKIHSCFSIRCYRKTRWTFGPTHICVKVFPKVWNITFIWVCCIVLFISRVLGCTIDMTISSDPRGKYWQFQLNSNPCVKFFFINLEKNVMGFQIFICTHVCVLYFWSRDVSAFTHLTGESPISPYCHDLREWLSTSEGKNMYLLETP